MLQAYADYNDLMDMTQEMVAGLVLAVKGSYKVPYHANGPSEPPVEIDFSPPWPRVPMVEGLGQALGVAMPADLETEEARLFLLQQVVFLPPRAAVSSCNLYAASRSCQGICACSMPVACLWARWTASEGHIDPVKGW